MIAENSRPPANNPETEVDINKCTVDIFANNIVYNGSASLYLIYIFDEESTDIMPFPGDVDNTKSLGEGKKYSPREVILTIPNPSGR